MTRPDDEGRFEGLARRVAEAALLAAVVCVPLFAQPNGARGFEGDRAVLLRLLGLLALVAVAVSVRRRETAPHPRRGIDLPSAFALLYVGASFVAAFLSVRPATALPGSYGRQAGLLTDLALLGVFLAAARAGRRDAALAAESRDGPARRLTDALVAGGAVAAALAVAQSVLPALGVPLPYVEAGSRAPSIAGGPTFLGSHLAAVLPIAAATARSRAGHLAAVLSALALLLTGSRAALLAGVAGVLLVAGLDRRRRRPLLLGLGATAGLVALSILPPVRDHLPGDALPRRIVEAFTTDQVETRGLLYRDAARAIGGAPERLAFGHGPDSAEVRFPAHVSDALQRRLGGAIVIDRMHCDALDLAWSRGLLGALGLLGLVGAALALGVRGARRAASSAEAIVPAPLVAFTAALAAVAVDGLLSVPGAVSRLALFVAAGWIAGRTARRPAGRAEAADDEDARGAAARRGVLAGLGAATFLFAVGDVRLLPLVAPLVLLLPAAGRGGALARAATVLGPFLLAHVAIDPAGATRFEALSPAASALRGRLDSIALLLTVVLGVVLLVRSGSRPGAGAPARDRPARRATGIALTLLLAALVRDDVRRVLADVDARVAYAADRVARRSDLAATLLEGAADLAPEVTRYRTRAAFALADAARNAAPETRDSLLLRAGTQVGRTIEKDPGDALARALGAGAVLLVARRIEERRHGLTERAWELVEPAVPLAPTSTPVLQIAAEVALARGDVDRAVAWLERAIAIDASSARSWQLKGRAEAARRNLSGAAFAYGRANV
ncbi:MAG: O-antigen ligase family protein, partial [Planctomycetota bacterium JB042]